EPPILLFLTLAGVKNCRMAFRHNDFSIPIDRDILLLPEVIIEDYNAIPEQILKPCFDSVWNACGYPASLNYDEQDKWKRW
ncbi:MAG: ATP-binding protein, partial [Candidatus Omnitrophota bacterium]